MFGSNAVQKCNEAVKTAWEVGRAQGFKEGLEKAVKIIKRVEANQRAAQDHMIYIITTKDLINEIESEAGDE